MRLLIFFFLFLYQNLFGSDVSSLFIGTYVEPHCQLRIEPFILGEDPLDIVGGESLRKIAEVNEVSNNRDGYEIYIETVNGGNLQNADGINAPYQLQYGLTGSLISPPLVGAPLLVKTSPALLGLTFSIEDLFIELPVNASLPAGYYTDTVIFTLTTL